MSAERIRRRLMKKEIERRIEERSCGECTACCTAMGVPSLEKQAGTPCVHEVKDQGCAAYATRPEECRNYYCLWRANVLDVLDKIEGRPDKLGLLFDVTRKGSMEQMLVVRPVWEGALESEAARGVIERLVAGGHLIFIVDGDQRRLVGPVDKVRRAQEMARRALPIARGS